MSAVETEPAAVSDRHVKFHTFDRLASAMGWTKASYTLFSAFLAVVLLIVIVWWPLVVDYFSQIDPAIPIWNQLDWLLIGIFAFMSLAIMAGADFRKDAYVVLIGLCGGLVIEGWGTQTQLWTYFTHERPPLWIIPAWPIASLTINRMAGWLDRHLPAFSLRTERWIFYGMYIAFLGWMLWFVWPTLNRSLTVLALAACMLLIMTPGNYRIALLTFFSGVGLGYFLEVWGTTRLCWTYYTLQTPPLFAVLAHGLAGFAFWRVGELFNTTIFRPFSSKIRIYPVKRFWNTAILRLRKIHSISGK